MSYLIRGTPDKFSPVFNPIVWYLDSSNKNEEKFKYLIEVYSGVSIDLGKYKVFPRPNDGYGVADIDKLLSTYTNVYLDQDLNILYAASGDSVTYKIEFGEEYLFKWPVTSIQGVFNAAATRVVTKFISTTPTASFGVQAGDNITITNIPAPDSYFNQSGIVESSGTNDITTDIPWNSTTPSSVITVPSGGYSIYTSGRPNQYSNQVSIFNYVGFNGAVSHQGFLSYTSSTYNLRANTQGKFLTNIPNDYTLRPENKLWMNLHSSVNLTPTNYFALLKTKYGTYRYDPEIGIADSPVEIFPIGPANVTAIEGQSSTTGIYWDLLSGSTYPVFKDTCWCFDSISPGTGPTTLLINTSGLGAPFTTTYELADILSGNTLVTLPIRRIAPTGTAEVNFPFSSWTIGQSGCISQLTENYNVQFFQQSLGFPTLSELKTFKVSWDTTRFGNVELYFLDRLGSIIPCNFELQNYKTINITRDEFQRNIGDLKDGRWQFNSTERGRQNINIKEIMELSLNSNWIKEDEANYLRELYTSPNVFIKENGKLWPVIITSNSYQVQTYNNIKNIQISITIQYSNYNPIQTF